MTGAMFDSSFSFYSGAPDPITAPYQDGGSAEISPFTSRCTSPQRTTQPRSYRDTRYDSHRARGSITALTAQLQSHGLVERRDSVISVDPDLDSEGVDDVDDEGYCEGPDTPVTTASDYSVDLDPTLYDLSMSTGSATSSPRPSLSLEAQALSSYTMRRRQRQTLIRLQCLATKTPDLAMLIEECHPSSLPLASEALWAATSSRSHSTCGFGIWTSRMDRECRPCAVRKAPRMRKRPVR